LPTPTNSSALDSRLYRAALVLCPPAFRREYADEMARDFDQARADAGSAIWQFRILMAIDLLRTVAVQWMRTLWPVAAIAGVLAALALAEGLASITRRATFEIPADPAQAEIAQLMLMAVTCVLLIAATIILNVWIHRPRRWGRR
jgi:hypothetical protein